MTNDHFDRRNASHEQRWLERPLGPDALDRMADAELQHGHAVAAEFLARRAEALREARS